MNAKLSEKLAKYDALTHFYLDKASKYDAKMLNSKPSEGGWSAVQVMYHLYIAEKGIGEYIAKKTQNLLELQPNSFVNKRNSVLLNLVLFSGKKVKAPASVATLPDEIDPAALAKNWMEQRAEFKKILNALPNEAIDKNIFLIIAIEFLIYFLLNFSL